MPKCKSDTQCSNENYPENRFIHIYIYIYIYIYILYIYIYNFFIGVKCDLDMFLTCYCFNLWLCYFCLHVPQIPLTAVRWEHYCKEHPCHVSKPWINNRNSNELSTTIQILHRKDTSQGSRCLIIILDLPSFLVISRVKYSCQKV